MRQTVLLFCLLSACNSAPLETATDADVDGGQCTPLTNQFNDWVADHQSCNSDGDCLREIVPVAGVSTCYVGINRADDAAYMMFVEALPVPQSCRPQFSPGPRCLPQGVCPAPTCDAGRCNAHCE